MNIPIAKFVESKIGLLVVGFCLTTILGTFINQMYHDLSWKQTKKYENYKRILDKHESLLAEISPLISRRAFTLQRVYWSLEYDYQSHKSTKKIDKTRIIERWDEYYSVVIKWNEDFRTYASKLRYLAGNGVADKFYISEKEANSESTKTLYGQFILTHNAILNLKKCVEEEKLCEHEKQSNLAKAQIENLFNKIDDFQYELQMSVDYCSKQLVQ